MGTPSDVRGIPRALFDELFAEHGDGAQEFLLRECGKETYIRPLHRHGLALAFRDFVSGHQESGAYVKILSRIPQSDQDMENHHPTKGIRVLGMVQALQRGQESAALSFQHGSAPIDLLQPYAKLLLGMLLRAQELAAPFKHIPARELVLS